MTLVIPKCLTCGKEKLLADGGWLCQTLNCGRLTPISKEERKAFSRKHNQLVVSTYDESDRDSGVCSECSGRGTIECGECDGDGETTCFHCDSEIDCKECDGKGRVTCDLCEGDGKE